MIENVNITIAAPLEKEGVEDVKTFIRGALQEAVTTDKSDAPAIREYAQESQEPDDEPRTIENTNRVFLHPKRGPFSGESGQWWFTKGNEAIPVTIKDKSFLDSYGMGEPRLNAEDVLESIRPFHLRRRS